MNKSIISLVLGATLCMGTAFASTQSFAEDCQANLAKYEQLTKYFWNQFEVGEATLVDVWEADLQLSKVQFECGVIAKTDYCSTATENKFQGLRDGVQEELQLGARTLRDLQRVESQYADFVTTCER